MLSHPGNEVQNALSNTDAVDLAKKYSIHKGHTHPLIYPFIELPLHLPSVATVATDVF